MPIPRWATHSASFCLGAALATTASVLLRSQSDKKSNATCTDTTSHQVSTPSSSSSTQPTSDPFFHPFKMMPSLPLQIFQPNPHILIAFDTRTKNPAFVLERLTSTSLHSNHGEKANRKNKRFHEETSLAPYHRSRNSYYKNSGYDRGHLAPAADFCSSEREMEDTFNLTNICPQYAALNRGMWLRLEEFVRSVALENEEAETWVITGPLWLPNVVKKSLVGGEEFGYAYGGIGKPPSLVAVPTHFFKVILVADKKDSQTNLRENGGTEPVGLKKFAAFVLRNEEDSAGDGKDKDRLMNHVVRLTDLEAVSGLEFFPGVLGSFVDGSEDAMPLNKVIADALTDDVRYNSSKSIKHQHDNGNDRALVPLSNSEEWSKVRQKKVKQILHDNSPLAYQHLCKENAACFKMFSA